MIEIKGQVVPERVTEETDFFNRVYNPDVLLCLANLSNDEVFTPPEIANEMLDMLPQELFEDPSTKFLDPACKSGVFLREIAKRLIKGLEDKIPDLEERIDHICKNQLYGIAITELTSLLSRRSVYCSKYPNGPFSIAKFDNVEGNIRFKTCKHEWEGPVKWVSEGGKQTRVWRNCKYCGASESQFGDDVRADLEAHAYEFIHRIKPEEIFNMKFDVICSNPPYQLATGGGSENTAKQAKPIYHHFVEQAMKLRPRYMTMIIPSRWFAGGMGLDNFRKTMIGSTNISTIVDFPNAKDCFPQNSISGGVCYFLWERDKTDNDCHFVNVMGDERNEMDRSLNEFSTLVRYNEAINIIRKVASFNEKPMSEITSSISPFGLTTKTRGTPVAYRKEDVKMHASSGVSYITPTDKIKENPYYDSYKVMVSQTSAEHAGEPGKDGTFRVLTSSMKVLGPTEVCTHSYILMGPTSKEKANNLLGYLKTRFCRFLCLQMLTSIHISKTTFSFVPMQDFSKSWTDEELYKKYSLTEEEILFIESIVKELD